MIRVWFKEKDQVVYPQLITDFIKAKHGMGLVVTSYDLSTMIKKQWGLVIDHHDTAMVLDNLAYANTGLVTKVRTISVYPQYKIN